MARMNDDDSELRDDPNLNPNSLPGVKQSTYSGPVPTTDYSGMKGSTNANSFGSSAGGFGGASTGFGGAAGGFGGPQGGFSGGASGNISQSGSTTNVNMSSGNQPVLTGAGSNAAQGADVLVENTNTDWVNKKWRPMMGWLYMATCTFDFVIFPVLWSLLQAINGGQVTSQWQPLTLQGAGLYHIAMGAVLGIAAYGRTKEKLSEKA